MYLESLLSNMLKLEGFGYVSGLLNLSHPSKRAKKMHNVHIKVYNLFESITYEGKVFLAFCVKLSCDLYPLKEADLVTDCLPCEAIAPSLSFRMNMNANKRISMIQKQRFSMIAPVVHFYFARRIFLRKSKIRMK